jgi:hypothetical protein
MVYYGILWLLGLLGYIMVISGVCLGILGYYRVYQGLLWCIMVYHGILRLLGYIEV